VVGNFPGGRHCDRRKKTANRCHQRNPQQQQLPGISAYALRKTANRIWTLRERTMTQWFGHGASRACAPLYSWGHGIRRTEPTCAPSGNFKLRTGDKVSYNQSTGWLHFRLQFRALDMFNAFNGCELQRSRKTSGHRANLGPRSPAGPAADGH